MPIAKVILVPLDSRPCNVRFPQQLGRIAGCEVLTPPLEILGNLHSAADREHVFSWLSVSLTGGEASICAVVASIDMICYGGLVSSRKPTTTLPEAEERLRRMSDLFRGASHIPIEAFNVITRLSITVDCDEVAGVYENLIRYAQLFDEARATNDLCLEMEAEKAKAKIPTDVLDSYLTARRRNHLINCRCIEETARGIFRSLTLCQEDAAPFGFHREEQAALRESVEANHLLDRVFIYPGADEVASFLLARALLQKDGLAPSLCVIYSTQDGHERIPQFEDRPLGHSIAERARCLGMSVVEKDEADILLFVNSPEPLSRQEACEKQVSKERRAALLPFVSDIATEVENGRHVVIADVAFPNGGDAEFVSLLLDRVPVSSLTAYAGWNTAGNTIGTVLAHGAMRWLAVSRGKAGTNEDTAHHRFLFERFIDDWVYQSLIRPELQSVWAPAHEASIFSLGEKTAEAEAYLRERLTPYVTTLKQQHFRDVIAVTESEWAASLPWRRIFEVDFRLF